MGFLGGAFTFCGPGFGREGLLGAFGVGMVVFLLGSAGPEWLRIMSTTDAVAGLLTGDGSKTFSTPRSSHRAGEPSPASRESCPVECPRERMAGFDTAALPTPLRRRSPGP